MKNRQARAKCFTCSHNGGELRKICNKHETQNTHVILCGEYIDKRILQVSIGDKLNKIAIFGHREDIANEAFIK